MKPIKRIEIIIDQPQLKDVIDVLDSIPVSGYTVMHEVTGRGDRGTQAGDGLSGEFSNSYILVACDAELVSILVERVRPILKTRGGVCLVSDAMWVKH